MDNIKIVNASLNDSDALADMFDLYRQFYRQPSDVKGVREFISERLEKNDSVIYVAKQGDVYTGFVQCYPLFTSVGMKKLWLLNDLFVRENFRGKGISRLLINRCKTLARETQAKGLMLETEITNAVGNWLYPQEDFKLIDKSNFYFWQA